MIQALVLDVDGVLVGEKAGYNSPNPHPDVMNRLDAIQKQGIPIVLCTGKPHYSISAIIEGARLTNPHITNGGSVVINPIDNKIIASHPINPTTAQEILTTCITHNFYTELYTVEDYYLLASQQSELTRIHSFVLQRDPIYADSLTDIAKNHDIVKIMPITGNESGMPAVHEALAPFSDIISVAWGLHPIANPHQFCGITAKGISKRQTTLDVLSLLHVRPEDTLGVGDSTSDWKYMDLCGYVATPANGQDPLKKLVHAKNNRGYIGGHVDDNGILSILDRFNLPSSDTHP